MHLLFLTAESCPTFRADVSVLFGKYLPTFGVDSDIVAGRTPGTQGQVSWGGGRALLCDMRHGAFSHRWRPFWHALKQLFAADAKRYQAIQVRDMPVVAAFGCLVARAKGLPFYYWMSYPIPEGQIELARARGLTAGLFKFLYPWLSGRVGRLLLRHFVLRLADHVFVQSDRMKQDLAAEGVDASKMTPVPMGVDLAELDRLVSGAVSTEVSRGSNSTIVYLGTLDRPRQIERLFDMLAILRSKRPEVRLLLVGDTEDLQHRTWLKHCAVLAGVDDIVEWTGWLPMTDAWRMVRSAAVCVSPCPRGPLLDCGSPTKVPEYLALEVPVVCNDNPDQAAVIRTSGAGLCVEYAAEAFAQAVLDILSLDDDARRELGRRGRAYVERHRDYRLIAANVAAAYASLAKGVQP